MKVEDLYLAIGKINTEYLVESEADAFECSTHFRIHRLLVVAAVLILCICIATPFAIATIEPIYQLVYQISPAAAQFFQPVNKSYTDQNVTMEVVSVMVEGDTAQAYITLTGETVDENCDLYDSYRFHLPFDQIGYCERTDYDETTHTAYFLCTTQTTDGSPIPSGGKMTFSLRQFLTGKEKVENLLVKLNLANYAVQSETVPTWIWPQEKTPGSFNRGGASYGDEKGELLSKETSMLCPNDEPILTPLKGISITAAGYADGYFHVQAKLENRMETDNHCWLWLEDDSGNRINCICRVKFHTEEIIPREDYDEFVFDIAPEDLTDCTLHGDFYTAHDRVVGYWQVTFPLKNMP